MSPRPINELRQVSLPPTAFKGKTTPEFCATFVLFCAVYTEFCATPLMGDSDICHVYTVTFGGSRCSQRIFTGLKHRKFYATFVLFCAVYAELCAMLLVADSDIIPCVHCGILVGLSVSKQFSSI